MKRTYLIALTIATLLLVWFIFNQSTAEAPVELDNTSDTDDPIAPPASDNVTADEITVEPFEFSTDEVDSIWLVVNKERPISLEYVPKELRKVEVLGRTDKSDSELSMREVAAGALEDLFAAASADELPLLLGSGYRDAELQAFYYNNYVATSGQKEADKFSARPGTSEHQIGLVADVAPESQECYLSACFAQTPEGLWVAENAHLYGFVIRYPEGKEAITGYQYEPWHLRYVGVELATDLFKSGQTLEEYFGLVN